MALTPCARCRQPFYAACHDGACLIGATLCPWCTYAEDTVNPPPAAPVSDARVPAASTPAVDTSRTKGESA